MSIRVAYNSPSKRPVQQRPEQLLRLAHQAYALLAAEMVVLLDDMSKLALQLERRNHHGECFDVLYIDMGRGLSHQPNALPVRRWLRSPASPI